MIINQTSGCTAKHRCFYLYPRQLHRPDCWCPSAAFWPSVCLHLVAPPSSSAGFLYEPEFALTVSGVMENNKVSLDQTFIIFRSKTSQNHCWRLREVCVCSMFSVNTAGCNTFHSRTSWRRSVENLKSRSASTFLQNEPLLPLLDLNF